MMQVKQWKLLGHRNCNQNDSSLTVCYTGVLGYFGAEARQQLALPGIDPYPVFPRAPKDSGVPIQ